MLQFFKTNIGRLRLLALLEGASLLVLIFIAVPLKYIFHYAKVSEFMGPLHGALFILFVLNTLSVAVERQWKFKQTTWKLLVACFIPFGTFYIDRKILHPIQLQQ